MSALWSAVLESWPTSSGMLQVRAAPELCGVKVPDLALEFGLIRAVRDVSCSC